MRLATMRAREQLHYYFGNFHYCGKLDHLSAVRERDKGNPILEQSDPEVTVFFFFFFYLYDRYLNHSTVISNF